MVGSSWGNSYQLKCKESEGKTQPRAFMYLSWEGKGKAK